MSAIRKTDYAEDAEQSVLGALILDNAAYFRVCGLLQAGDFYQRWHREIYRAIGKLVTGNSAADVLTLSRELEGDVDLAYLGAIANNTPSAANVQAYAKIVKDRAISRNLKLALNNAIISLEDTETEAVITSTMTSLQNLMQNGTEDVSFLDALDLAQAKAEEAAKRRATGTVLGCSTTLPTLDRLTGGLSGPKMVVLGGRPGTYKSALAWQILMRAAARGTPVGICSLEMEAPELAARAISHELKLNGHDYTSGFPPTVRAAKSLPDAMKSWPIRIDDKAAKLGQIMARIIEWKYRYNIEIACIDHMQLIGQDRNMSRFDHLSEVSRQIKLLAMRLGIPILVLSQLSREVEKQNRRPMLADLRECGNIEQDADMVIFLHCEAGKGQDQDNYECILAKQRGGAAREAFDLMVNGQHFLVGERA